MCTQLSVQSQVLLPKLQLDLSRFQIQMIQFIVMSLMDIVHHKHDATSTPAPAPTPQAHDDKKSRDDKKSSRSNSQIRMSAPLLDDQAQDTELPDRGVPPSAFHLRVTNAIITLNDAVSNHVF